MVSPRAFARRGEGVWGGEGVAVLERERSLSASGDLRVRRPGRGRSHHEWRSAEAAGRRMEPPLARGHAHARDFCAGGGIWRGVRARVIPGHRAAMNPESGADVAGDSGFALTRAPE